MRTDVGETEMDLGDAVRIGIGLGLGEKARPFGVSSQYHVDQGFRPGRRLLRHLANPPISRDLDRAFLRRQLTGDEVEQRALAGAVSPHETSASARRQAHRRAVEQRAVADPVGEVGYLEHCALVAEPGRRRQAVDGKCGRAYRRASATPAKEGIDDCHCPERAGRKGTARRSLSAFALSVPQRPTALPPLDQPSLSDLTCIAGQAAIACAQPAPLLEP
jgi:hypothetical protein